MSVKVLIDVSVSPLCHKPPPQHRREGFLLAPHDCGSGERAAEIPSRDEATRRTQMRRGLLIRDDELRDSIIEQRKKTGADLYDEVWEGMYVMPSLPTVAHQK